MLRLASVDLDRACTAPEVRTEETTMAEHRQPLSGLAATCVLLAGLASASSTEARVTRIVIDSTSAVTGQVIAYETVRGRAFGELDPADAHNAVITDLQLGRDADGKVRYETTFTLTKPVDMSLASGFLWHDVPNRGGNIIINVIERNLGDIGLASGWQADNAGATAIPTVHSTGTNHWVQVPMARENGQLVTGKVLARIINRSGVPSQPLNVMGNPVPYLPATLDTTQAVLTTHTKETVNGQISVGNVIPSSQWAFARCTATT
ncbi:MAG: hypothetical protein H0W83_15080, partial [Planctomycetes bacterium]|nr:hypothetical protein [Planctomycetota bacterium]